MSRRSAVVVAAFVFATASLHADSVTTRDGAALRGRVVALDGRGALVTARFADGEAQVLVPREAIVAIEFNAMTSNAGFSTLGQPSALPARRQAPATNQTEDVIVLRSGERRPCPLVEIDGQRLRCGGEVLALGDVTSLTIARAR
jgi:hypothetical protein